MTCNCADWKENIAKVNAPLMLQAARSGFHPSANYDGVRFRFCPWCSNPLYDVREAFEVKAHGSPRQLPKSSSSATLSVTEGQQIEQLRAALSDARATFMNFGIDNDTPMGLQLRKAAGRITALFNELDSGSVTEAHPKEERDDLAWQFARSEFQNYLTDNFGFLLNESQIEHFGDVALNCFKQAHPEAKEGEQEIKGAGSREWWRSGKKEPLSANTHVLQTALGILREAVAQHPYSGKTTEELHDLCEVWQGSPEPTRKAMQLLGWRRGLIRLERHLSEHSEEQSTPPGSPKSSSL